MRVRWTVRVTVRADRDGHDLSGVVQRGTERLAGLNVP
jgi:hypothetical protein